VYDRQSGEYLTLWYVSGFIPACPISSVAESYLSAVVDPQDEKREEREKEKKDERREEKITTSFLRLFQRAGSLYRGKERAYLKYADYWATRVKKEAR
jgi:hypothetical protein